MTKNIPFPPALARLSSQNAGAAYQRTKGMGPHDRVELGYACYRMPDGQVRPAYDLYRPEYPEGTEPGIGKVSYTCLFSANGFEGYRAQAHDFVPAEEFLRSDPLDNPGGARNPTGRLSIALVEHDGASGFIWAQGEESMKGWTDAFPDDARVTRYRPSLHGMENGEFPTCLVAVQTSGNRECHIASSEEAMAAALRSRFKILENLDAPLEGLVERMREHGQDFGWKVDVQIGTSLEEAPFFTGLSYRLTELNGPYQDLTGMKTPSAAMIRPMTPIFLGAIEYPGTEPVLVWGADDAALSRRLANTLNEIIGSPARNDQNAGNVDWEIAAVLEHHPGLTIRTGRGRAFMAYGADPTRYVMAQEIQSGHSFAIASSTDQSLLQYTMQFLAPDEETCDVDDLHDARWKIDQAGKFSMIAMEDEERPVRIDGMRQALSAALTPEMS